MCLSFKSLYILREREREGEREREHVQMGGGGAESERIRIPSRFCAIGAEPNTGLHPTNREIMT